MKRVIFSDVHLHTWAYGATVDDRGYNSRLAAQEKALKQMVDYIEEHNVKHVYFGGDLFHTHGKIPTQALQVAAMTFKDIRDRGAKITAIYGNHDMDDRHGRIHALSWLDYSEIGGVHHKDSLDDISVHTLPYTEDEDELKRFLEGAGNTGGMALLHQGVAGVPLSSGYVLDEKLTPEMIPDNVVAFTGHYHYHRRVSDRLTVIGNLAPLNWSDIDQPKGFVVWDDETGEIEQVLQQHAPAFISWGEEIEKHSDISNVEGSFVRWIDTIKQKDQEDIRQHFIGQGALTVEFPKTEIEIGESKIQSGDDITVEHLVAQYENQDMEPRRLQVGREVRENTYEAPKA